MDRRLLWLRISYWVGAIVDGLWILPMAEELQTQGIEPAALQLYLFAAQRSMVDAFVFHQQVTVKAQLVAIARVDAQPVLATDRRHKIASPECRKLVCGLGSQGSRILPDKVDGAIHL